MSIEKKSLISTLKTTKKANVASTVAAPDLHATHVASKRPTFKASKRPTFKASKRPTFKASKRPTFKASKRPTFKASKRMIN